MKEERIKIFYTNSGSNISQGFEAYAIGKILSIEKVNHEAMYRVFKSIWYTKEEVNFVVTKEGVILVKFWNVEDDTVGNVTGRTRNEEERTKRGRDESS